MEHAIHQSAEYVSLLVNVFAIIAVAFGSIKAFIGLARGWLTHATEDELRPVWLSFGRWLVAGLTFQLASDIVETTLAPSWADVGMLGAIAVIRTFLNYFLDKDMDTLRERDKEAAEEKARAGIA